MSKKISGSPAACFIEEAFLIFLNRYPSARELEVHVNKFRSIHRDKKQTIEAFLNCEERALVLNEKNLLKNHLFSSDIPYRIGRHAQVKKILYENPGYFPEFVGEILSREEETSIANSKKIAICLTGHIRNRDAVNSIVCNIVNSLEADVFIHIWNSFGNRVLPRPVYSNGPVPDQIKLNEEEIEEFLHSFFPPPKGVLIESNEEFLEKISPIIKKNREKIIHFGVQHKNELWTGASDPKYILSQMYGWSACHSLVEEHENQNKFEYDHIIKLRLDFKVRPATREELLPSIFDPKYCIRIPDPPHCSHPGHKICTICCDKNNISKTPKEQQHFHDTDICDIIAHGNREVMRTYLTTFDFWEEILEEMNQDNISLLSMQQSAIEIPKLSFLKKLGSWAGRNYRICCDINVDDNIRINCFYPERFLLYRLKNLILRPSPLRGRIVRGKTNRKI